MKQAGDIANDFCKDFNIERLLKDIIELLNCNQHISWHVRVLSRNKYELVDSFGWIKEYLPTERTKDDPYSSSVLVSKTGFPLFVDIKKYKDKSYKDIIISNEEMFNIHFAEDVGINIENKLDSDFINILNKALENKTHYLLIIPINLQEHCLAIIHLFCNKKLTNNEMEKINNLRKELILPFSNFKEYFGEDKLLNSICELNENLLNKNIFSTDLINLLINLTAKIFNVDECTLSLIYKDKDNEYKKDEYNLMTKYRRFIRVVGSSNINDNTKNKCKEILIKKVPEEIKDIFKKTDLDILEDINDSYLDNQLQKLLDDALLQTPLEEDNNIILQKTKDSKKRFGLRRLCAKTKEIIVFYPENSGQKRKIEFYSMSRKGFISGEELKKNKELQEAEKIVKEYQEWQRYKGHLIFFIHSNFDFFNVVHAPLLIGKGKEQELIGVLSIENKINYEGKVGIHKYSVYELETFKKWVNIISYCIENRSSKDLLRQIIDSSPQGIIFSDISGKVIEISPRAKNILKIEDNEVDDVREIYFDEDNLNKISVGLKKATEKSKGKEEGFDGYFAILKNFKKNDNSRIVVEGSAYNLHNFIPKLLPRLGTVGYINLEKQEAIADIILEGLFDTLSSKGKDPEKVISSIIKEIPRIFEAESCILLTSNKRDLLDARQKSFLEEEHKRIVSKQNIRYIASNEFETKGKEVGFSLKEELGKFNFFRILNNKESVGLDLKEPVKYLVIPESNENISFLKEGLTAYAVRTKKIIRLDEDKENHPSRDGKKTGNCKSVLIIPILQPIFLGEEKSHEEIIGVLKIQNKYRGIFTEIDEIVGKIIAKALSFLIIGGVSLYNRECGIKILD
ncbi:MAG: hypothetical protein ACMUHX_07675, partial [bacterium]